MSEKSKKSTAGFTIAEVLIALAVVSILLAAVAVAFNATAINYRENNNIFNAINSARQTLSRMTTQLRTADAVNPDSLTNECSLITAGGDDITYRYNNSAKKLYLVTNDIATDSDYVLCDNVTAITFTKDIVTEGSQTKVKSVQISITVAAGDLQRTLSAAAVIRRNLN
jgi:prepilin-type N-terminal cleavage/methylation domain-containing protein